MKIKTLNIESHKHLQNLHFDFTYPKGHEKVWPEYFNPLLNKLNLEIDLINTEYFIPIKLKNKDGVVPFRDLSTGTKLLVLSLFPLFELNTDDSVVLIDEPERSLFPDMQMICSAIISALRQMHNL